MKKGKYKYKNGAIKVEWCTQENYFKTRTIALNRAKTALKRAIYERDYWNKEIKIWEDEIKRLKGEMI